jgi:uncharacterized RDD family membrane protein YckC
MDHTSAGPAQSLWKPYSEMEKRTNQRLAIGVGVLGLAASAALYFFFYIVMQTNPGMFFGLLPGPSRTTAVRSDGKRVYLFSSKLDMSTVSFKEKQEAEEKPYFAILEGTDLSKPRETPAFVTASGWDGRIVLFNDGGYNVFDGTRWADEVRSAGIGKSPKGIATPQGLYVMSRFADGLHITRVQGDSSINIPFPEEFLRARPDYASPSSELVWYEGQLCLFWSTNDSINWTRWNGASWAPAAASPFSGAFQVAADGKRLHFVHQEDAGPQPTTLSYYVFENNEWNGPSLLTVQHSFNDWGVFSHQGKPLLLARRSFFQTLYTIEKGALTNPIRLIDTFHPLRIAERAALIALFACLALLVYVFGVSALIDTNKSRSWQQDKEHYEFASLFRRSLAYFIDTLVILIPAALVIAWLVAMEEIPWNPVQFMFMVLYTAAWYLFGGFLYHTFLEGLFGATLGKKICGIRVLKADFTPCGIVAGFLRNLLRIFDSFFYYLVGAVALAGTLKWQRLGDRAADTVVVRNT